MGPPASSSDRAPGSSLSPEAPGAAPARPGGPGIWKLLGSSASARPARLSLPVPQAPPCKLGHNRPRHPAVGWGAGHRAPWECYCHCCGCVMTTAAASSQEAAWTAGAGRGPPPPGATPAVGVRQAPRPCSGSAPSQPGPQPQLGLPHGPTGLFIPGADFLTPLRLFFRGPRGVSSLGVPGQPVVLLLSCRG